MLVQGSSLRSSVPQENILDYLAGIRRGEWCGSGDVVISCNNGTVPADRLVLGAVSQLLLLQFSSTQTEETAVLILPDFTAEEVSQYLQAVYSCQDLTKFSDLNNMIGFQLAVHFLPSLSSRDINANGRNLRDRRDELVPEVKLEEFDHSSNEEINDFEEGYSEKQGFENSPKENGSRARHSRTKKSIVWKYFIKDPDDECLCICQICEKVVISNKINTSNMMNHLVTQHGIIKTGSPSVPRARLKKKTEEAEVKVKKLKQTRKKRSPVWEHFVKDPEDVAGTRCICQICQKVVLSINVSIRPAREL